MTDAFKVQFSVFTFLCFLVMLANVASDQVSVLIEHLWSLLFLYDY